MKPSPRRARTVLALAAIGAACNACAPPPDRPRETRPATTAAAQQSHSATPRADDVVDLRWERPTPAPIEVEQTVQSFWWHTAEIARDLALRAEQVAAMDAAARRYLGAWSESIAVRRNGTRTIVSALSAGDLEAATAAIERFGGAVEHLEVGPLRLKVEVVALLDNEQRSLLAKGYSQLLRDPWIIAGRLGRPRRGGG